MLSNLIDQMELIGSEEKVLEEVSFSKDYTKLEFDDLNS